jgi:hypothetical protein
MLQREFYREKPLYRLRRGPAVLDEDRLASCFSKVLYTVTLYSKHNRTLTFENSCQTYMRHIQDIYVIDILGH